MSLWDDDPKYSIEEVREEAEGIAQRFYDKLAHFFGDTSLITAEYDEYLNAHALDEFKSITEWCDEEIAAAADAISSMVGKLTSVPE